MGKVLGLRIARRRLWIKGSSRRSLAGRGWPYILTLRAATVTPGFSPPVDWRSSCARSRTDSGAWSPVATISRLWMNYFDRGTGRCLRAAEPATSSSD